MAHRKSNFVGHNRLGYRTPEATTRAAGLARSAVISRQSGKQTRNRRRPSVFVNAGWEREKISEWWRQPDAARATTTKRVEFDIEALRLCLVEGTSRMRSLRTKTPLVKPAGRARSHEESVRKTLLRDRIVAKYVEADMQKESKRFDAKVAKMTDAEAVATIRETHTDGTMPETWTYNQGNEHLRSCLMTHV